MHVPRPSCCLCVLVGGEDVDGIGIDGEMRRAVSKAVERLQSILEGGYFGRLCHAQPSHEAVRRAGVGIGETLVNAVQSLVYKGVVANGRSSMAWPSLLATDAAPPRSAASTEFVSAVSIAS